MEINEIRDQEPLPSRLHLQQYSARNQFHYMRFLRANAVYFFRRSLPMKVGRAKFYRSIIQLLHSLFRFIDGEYTHLVNENNPCQQICDSKSCHATYHIMPEGQEQNFHIAVLVNAMFVSIRIGK